MKIFLTGASGFTGGSIAAALLTAGHSVIGLARTEERAAQIQSRGMEPRMGDLDDAVALTGAAAEADAVVHAADADHRRAVEVILAALKGTGKAYLHTSGSGMLADKAGGESSPTIYEDDTPVQPVVERAARVKLNEDVLAASRGGIRSVVIVPPMIYGEGKGITLHSNQIPKMIEVTKSLGAGMYVGKGENRWSNVHIDDLSNLFVLALESAPPGAFYYVENGENALKDLAAAISRTEGFGGRTRSLTIEESVHVYGHAMTHLSLGSNSRVRGLRARRELGWRPVHQSLMEEIDHGWYAHGGR